MRLISVLGRAHRSGWLALSLILASCVHQSDRALSDLERTWLRARVVLPAVGGTEPEFTHMSSRGLTKALRARGLTRPLPTVLYMHGCTGIGNRAFLERLAAAGYAVIAPDSFARTYRPRQCDPRRKTGGYNLFVYEFRLAEISYALHRLRELDWVDRSNLFLLGSSEGGVAVALYRGNAFRARVIAQWTCKGAPIVRGIAAPLDEPILAIVAANDPWYDPTRTQAQTGHCGEFMSGRPGSRSVVLRGRASHDVLKDPRNVELILSFLGRHRVS